MFELSQGTPCYLQKGGEGAGVSFWLSNVRLRTAKEPQLSSQVLFAATSPSLSSSPLPRAPLQVVKVGLIEDSPAATGTTSTAAFSAPLRRAPG